MTYSTNLKNFSEDKRFDAQMKLKNLKNTLIHIETKSHREKLHKDELEDKI